MRLAKKPSVLAKKVTFFCATVCASAVECVMNAQVLDGVELFVEQADEQTEQETRKLAGLFKNRLLGRVNASSVRGIGCRSGYA